MVSDPNLLDFSKTLYRRDAAKLTQQRISMLQTLMHR